MRSGKSLRNLDGPRGRISPSSTVLPSKSPSACLSLRRTWFVLRLICSDLDAFRQELTKLGWTEGKNITIEYRFAEQKPERLPELAADLVRLKVDLIVATAGPPALAAKKATTSI